MVEPVMVADSSSSSSSSISTCVCTSSGEYATGSSVAFGAREGYPAIVAGAMMVGDEESSSSMYVGVVGSIVVVVVVVVASSSRMSVSSSSPSSSSVGQHSASAVVISSHILEFASTSNASTINPPQVRVIPPDSEMTVVPGTAIPSEQTGQGAFPSVVVVVVVVVVPRVDEGSLAGLFGRGGFLDDGSKRRFVDLEQRSGRLAEGGGGGGRQG
mmetsp:Transcript_40019/g.83730  ORF Transcript_40019/g.83730 Transcript_40019/m.83730 type:complete len:214 (+) Transcript_40019:572-1213(+)